MARLFSSMNKAYKYSIGFTIEGNATVDEVSTEAYSKLTGDTNPLHLDEKSIPKNIFKKNIAHGMHCASFIPALFNQTFNQNLCVYLSQSIIFKKPVYIGDQFTIKLVLMAISKNQTVLTFNTECLVGEEVVIQGIAEILLLKR